MAKETGGPAFPTTKESHLMICSEGMTLRDYFAAKAMQGGASQIFSRAAIAEHAYLMADAMIAERDKNE